MALRRAAEEVAATTAGAAMGLLAAARRGKAVHPQGEVYRARVRISGDGPRGSELLSRPGEYDAIVRFSRSIGLPRPLPDLLGFSLRIPDAYGKGHHQDFMLVTSVDRPVLRHIFVPAGGVADRPYSSSLPYRAGDERFVVGVLPVTEQRFQLAVAKEEGRFRNIGEVTIGERFDDVADALRFNPFNTGGGLEPSGLLNDLRRKAYPMSQRTWGRLRRGAAHDQERADAVTGS